MLAIGGAAGAGSFRHVHDVAAAHGQAGWPAWADSVVLELMSVAWGLRRRKREHRSTWFPAVVMAVSVVLSLSAQVEAERSVIGWVAAAIPAMPLDGEAGVTALLVWHCTYRSRADVPDMMNTFQPSSQVRLPSAFVSTRSPLPVGNITETGAHLTPESQLIDLSR
jgi:hypothetical protein